MSTIHFEYPSKTLRKIYKRKPIGNCKTLFRSQAPYISSRTISLSPFTSVICVGTLYKLKEGYLLLKDITNISFWRRVFLREVTVPRKILYFHPDAKETYECRFKGKPNMEVNHAKSIEKLFGQEADIVKPEDLEGILKLL